ncbi:amidophosphoribosyltransferase [Caulobacter flavus]|uniref:Amidophosphoribosyltransferase n=2 Tax=Caulobacter flavus TaxID=1679497 RepID=A0A2N5CN43_9CAUL|nr:amidophosphoribosyltransferase [Caulobacter flavus]PLR07864.1 amidophosphoribosyltransferase [Caulobacter flavus]
MRAEHGDSFSRWKPGPRLMGLGRGLLDLILPPRAFDGEPALTPGLSAGAWSRIVFLDGPVCDGCGAPFPFDQGEPLCALCQAQPRAFARARAACLYDEHSRDLVLKLKHADRTDLSGLFARWISRAAPDLLDEAQAVVPVPMHRARLLRRRYNQAAEIARPLARAAGRPYLADALVRKRDTASQGGKSADGRRRNVAAAFAVPDAKRPLIEGKRVLLVDDVLTTGATAEGCARALLAAGASAVDLTVVARVTEMRSRPI